MLLCATNKKGKTRNLTVPVFPSPSGLSCVVQQTSLTYSIMKHDDFFKHNSHFQNKISSSYSKQATVYQSEHNQKHPQQRIWRHMLYKRTFYFSLNGRNVSVEVEIVRFRYVGTNSTFTFYGSLFCAYSHFSVEFIKEAVSSSGELLSQSALTVSIKTLNCWRKWIRNSRFSHEPPENRRP